MRTLNPIRRLQAQKSRLHSTEGGLCIAIRSNVVSLSGVYLVLPLLWRHLAVIS